MLMTLEEIKAKVRARLTDGWGQCVDGGLNCVYNDGQGLGCAVGCLIPDSLHDPGMETGSMDRMRCGTGVWKALDGSDIHDETLAEVLNAAGIPATQEVREFLVLAQQEHDDPSSWGDDNKVRDDVLKELGL